MSTIITRNSANSGSTPSSLVQGELAINVTDGRLFYGSGSGNVVKEFNTVTSASYSTTASFITSSGVYGPYGSNSILTASYADTASFSLAASANQILVLNQSGQNIAKGTVVHITASVSSGDTPHVITASYENDNNSANTLGITSQLITNGSTGYVITEGVVTGINTNNFQSGQLVYLGATGSITGSAPLAPLHSVRLGQVIRHQSNNGSIYVRIDNGYELGELHDVRDLTTTSSYGDLLTKSGSIWTTGKQLTGSYGLTGSLTATSLTGSLHGTSSWAQNSVSASYFSGSISNAVSASYALTASYALNGGGGGPAFPYTGSAEITGSLGVTGSLGQGYNVIASGSYSHAEGDTTQAIGDYSHAEGSNTQAIGLYSHVEGTNTGASGIAAHAEGSGSAATGLASHAEGKSTTAQGIASHAEGEDTQAIANYSHAEGQLTVSAGNYSHAEGYTNVSSGNYSHAEGASNYSQGDYSHAEGETTSAEGQSSHTEGKDTLTIANYSHAEGKSTVAGYRVYSAQTPITSGVFELSTSYGDKTPLFTPGTFIIIDDQLGGINGTPNNYKFEVSSSIYNGTPATEITLVDTSVNTPNNKFVVGILGNSSPSNADNAIGFYSHAEGENTETIGKSSNTQGLGTISLGYNQSVVGQYNDPVSDLSAFIIGDGIDDLTRHNLLVANSGSVIIDGQLYSLISTSTPILDTNFISPYGTSGPSGIELDTYNIYDSAGSQSINWNNRELYDLSGVSIDWFTRTLYDGSGTASLNWEYSVTGNERSLTDANNVISLRWNSRRLTDNSDSSSIDWSNDFTDGRTLYNSAGTKILRWGANPYFSGSLYGTASWASNVVSASYATTASYVKNAQTASYVLNAVSSSYSTTASFAVSASWAPSSGVTINNNTNNYLLTATGTANTVNGESNLKFDGSVLEVTGSVIIDDNYQLIVDILARPGVNPPAISLIQTALIDSSNNIALYWDAKQTYDNSTSQSIDWQNRQLKDTDGSTVVLDWNTRNLYGTASFATTASYVQTAQTASYVLNAVSSSFTSTASYVNGMITKNNAVANTSFTGTPRKATVTFTTPFPNANYSIVVTGEDLRSWTIESKVSGSFVINTNSNAALAGSTYWQATSYGEFRS